MPPGERTIGLPPKSVAWELMRASKGSAICPAIIA